jgi:hypothetical protein
MPEEQVAAEDDPPSNLKLESEFDTPTKQKRQIQFGIGKWFGDCSKEQKPILEGKVGQKTFQLRQPRTPTKEALDECVFVHRDGSLAAKQCAEQRAALKSEMQRIYGPDGRYAGVFGGRPATTIDDRRGVTGGNSSNRREPGTIPPPIKRNSYGIMTPNSFSIFLFLAYFGSYFPEPAPGLDKFWFLASKAPECNGQIENW